MIKITILTDIEWKNKNKVSNNMGILEKKSTDDQPHSQF